MGRNRMRLLVCAAGALALIVASALFLDWFRASLAMDVLGIDLVKIDLRSVHMCTPDGVCASIPLGKLKGLYAMFAQTAFFGSLAFGALIAYQAGTRYFGGVASERLTRIGYAIGSLLLTNVLFTGYLFPPEYEALSPDRTWAPALMLLGSFLGLAALALSIAEDSVDDEAGEYKPVTIPGKTPSSPGDLTSSSQRGLTSSSSQGKSRNVPDLRRVDRSARKPTIPPAATSPEVHEGTPTTPVPTRRVPDELPVTADPSEAVTTDDLPSNEHLDLPASRPAIPRATAAVERVAAAITQEALRKRLAYATASAELRATGIDARREDGLAKFIRWREVVGVVARRLPASAPYEGLTFVDLVSTAGATLRFLPWTKLSGDEIEGEGDERARALAQLIAARCPEAHVDPATRTFLGSRGPAAQLPDGETLAAHDARLA